VAALQSVLAYYGEDVREDVLSKALRANRSQGTARIQIQKYASKHLYAVESHENMDVLALKKLLDQGKPVICLIQAWADKPVEYKSDWSDGHYVVAAGYDQENLYLMDPSVGGHYSYISASDFLNRWHDKDGKSKLHHFGMAVSKPNVVPETDSVQATQ
jgi:ABC-type bacteriocin/lantibiotic exporter with double-glycine peptidase domain